MGVRRKKTAGAAVMAEASGRNESRNENSD